MNLKDLLMDMLKWNDAERHWMISDSDVNILWQYPNSAISDGDHTFEELYYHRMILFSLICKMRPEKAWKSWKHSDDSMYEDYFIVGIGDESGYFSYHYHKKYWNQFDIKQIAHAPEWNLKSNIGIERLEELL